jgi:hypothetical protein
LSALTVTIKKIVRWEDFRADIEAVTEAKPEEPPLHRLMYQ